MNKYFSDYLPAAMVRDLRRSRRSRGYFIMLLLALMLAAWMLVTKAEYNGIGLVVLGIAVCWFVVPNRAGAAVSADAKVKGTNFMMLTPLGSRRIVWSIWFSALCQLLVVAALGAMLLQWRHMVVPPAEVTGTRVIDAWIPSSIQAEWIVYGVIVAIGAVMCAACIFLAQLNRFFRVVATLLAVAYAVLWLLRNLPLLLMSDNALVEVLSGFDAWHYSIAAVDALVLVVTLLELARRSYASPAENCSRALRVLVLLNLCSAPAMYYLLPMGELQVLMCFSYTLAYSVFVCMSDAMLPTYSLPAQAKRAWRCVPVWLQVPGLWQAGLFLTLVMVGYGCLEMLWLPSVFPDYVLDADAAVYGATQIASVTYYLLFGLLLADLICRPANVNRPVVCVSMLLAQTFVLGVVSALFISAAPAVVALLPLGASMVNAYQETPELWPLLLTCCLCVLMLAMLRLRGNRSR